MCDIYLTLRTVYAPDAKDILGYFWYKYNNHFIRLKKSPICHKIILPAAEEVLETNRIFYCPLRVELQINKCNGMTETSLTMVFSA